MTPKLLIIDIENAEGGTDMVKSSILSSLSLR